MTELMLEQEYYRFKQAIQGGARLVIAHQQELNKINVFPVSDGDTGSNLASLMETILNETSEQLSSSLALFERVADASLIGARGNSGIIMAQYFNGLYENLGEEEGNSFISQFVKSAKLAVNHAYQAIERPLEGTMVTVIRSWGEALHEQNQHESIEKRLDHALEVAKSALEKTTEQLEVLRKNQVVDSGAKGFYLFVEGFTRSFNHPDLQLVEEEATPLTVQIHQQELVSEKPVHRYCTEVLLTGVVATKDELQTEISHLGNSLVIALNRGKARIHLHTNQPAKVLSQLRAFGQPVQQKADDMLLQYEIRQQQKAKIALVTDSIADIPADYLLTQQIHVLPMTILLGGANYLDRLTIENQELFEQQKSGGERGTTSQPALSQIDNLFAYLATHYESIIVVTVSEKMSGTYQSVKRIAQKGLLSAPIEVIDSQQNSAAQALLVMRINQWIQAGEHFETIIEKAYLWRQNIQIFVSVDDLEPMIQSGRVPQSVGRIAQKLNLKPLVGVADGAGVLSGFSLSLAANESKMLKKIMKYHQKRRLLRYGIVYAGHGERVAIWQKLLSDKLGMEPAFVMPVSTVVALSAGAGSIAVAFEIDEGVKSR